MADTDPQKAKYLNNREEMNQALTNFTDAHNSLITNKDDYMTNQSLRMRLKGLKKSWSESGRIER